MRGKGRDQRWAGLGLWGHVLRLDIPATTPEAWKRKRKRVRASIGIKGGARLEISRDGRLPDSFRCRLASLPRRFLTKAGHSVVTDRSLGRRRHLPCTSIERTVGPTIPSCLFFPACLSAYALFFRLFFVMLSSTERAAFKHFVSDHRVFLFFISITILSASSL